MTTREKLEHDNSLLRAELAEVQRDLDESQRVFRQIIDFSSRLGVTTELQELYRSCLHLFKDLLHLDFATLFLTTEDKDSLVICDTLGFDESMVGSFSVHRGIGLPGLVMDSRQVETVEDFHSEQRFNIPDVIFEKKITSAIATPMMLNKQLFGVIIGHTVTKTRFSEGEQALTRIFANQSATAIRNASHIQSLHVSEQNLQLRTAEFETIFANTMAGIMLLKGGRVLARCNRKLADLMGYDSAEELEGISMRQFHLSEERFLEFGKKYYNSLVSGDHLQAEYQLRRKDGQSLLCLLSGKAIDTHSPPDLNKGVVWIIEDISQRKDMEEELLKVRKLESIGVLAGGIAHDFNNLLSAILGNVELAGRRIADSDEKTSALLSRARKATVRAAKLTDQLLTFSKGGEPIKAKTALPELITETADFVLHGSSVACSYQFPKQLWRVNADSGQISQVIQNIILNTKHAMPDGGTVSISCANVRPTAAEPQLNMEPGDYVRISIEDNGVGIAEGIIDRIFDPYFSTKQEGSGLGLAVCHSIIKKHGGSLTVDSVPGEGTTFTIYLPAIRSKTDTPGTASGIATPAKTAHIMFMDDEKILREVAQAMLTSLEHKAILVEDGEQALNTYQRLQNTDSPVDLVIMDLTIPGAMGGREAAEKLLQFDPQAKIIVASGYSNDPVMANYREYGFDAAVTKPFDLAGLSKVIESALQGP